MPGGVRRPGTRILATRDTQASFCAGIKKRRARIGRLALLPAARGGWGARQEGASAKWRGRVAAQHRPQRMGVWPLGQHYPGLLGALVVALP